MKAALLLLMGAIAAEGGKSHHNEAAQRSHREWEATSVQHNEQGSDGSEPLLYYQQQADIAADYYKTGELYPQTPQSKVESRNMHTTTGILSPH
jgi:hypothetical protein